MANARGRLALLRLTYDRRATDPHDKVYGVLAMVTSDHEKRMLLPVDYSLPVLDLYVMACVACMGPQGTNADLSFLRNVYYRREMSLAKSATTERKWPSWVPDWTSTDIVAGGISETVTEKIPTSRTGLAFGIGQLHGKGSSISGKTVSSGVVLHHHEHMFSTNRGPSLRVRGVRLLRIQAFIPGCKEAGMYEYGHALYKALRHYTHTQFSVFDAYCYILKPGLHGEGTQPLLTSTLTFWEYIKLCSSSRRIEWPMCPSINQDRSLFQSSDRITATSRKELRWHGIIPIHVPEKFDERKACSECGIVHALVGPKAFVSTTGYMGYVPGCTQVGDEIAIIFGVAVPFVIRYDDEGHFILIGECFVLGLMNGQAMEDLDEQRVGNLYFW